MRARWMDGGARLDHALKNKGGEDRPARGFAWTVRSGVVWATTEATEDGISLFSQEQDM